VGQRATARGVPQLLGLRGDLLGALAGAVAEVDLDEAGVDLLLRGDVPLVMGSGCC
jgi:hypothetical protein